jgi:hypothetical protein
MTMARCSACRPRRVARWPSGRPSSLPPARSARRLVPMRVSEDDERQGLDIASHGERGWGVRLNPEKPRSPGHAGGRRRCTLLPWTQTRPTTTPDRSNCRRFACNAAVLRDALFGSSLSRTGEESLADLFTIIRTPRVGTSPYLSHSASAGARSTTAGPKSVAGSDARLWPNFRRQHRE